MTMRYDEDLAERINNAKWENPKMRYDEEQALLWTKCVKYNERYPLGSSITIEEKNYSVVFPFNVISNGIKANLLDMKTHRHTELIVSILDENGEWADKV